MMSVWNGNRTDRARRTKWIGLPMLFAAVIGALSGCHVARNDQRADSPAIQTKPDTPPAATSIPPLRETAAPPSRDAEFERDNENRWLVVEAARAGTEGGWATGSFDAERNKIAVTTRDVQRFAIDVSRIPIHWEKLVILSIDGVNTELKERDYHVYHFARDRHGAWRVVEP